MIRNAPRDAAVYGVDLGKNLFHVVGVDEHGAVVQRAKFRRNTLLAFFERAAHAVVGMEACPGSQWLARKLMTMGHQVRIVPAQFVKPYVKSQKNDTIDAEAIAEAVTRPTMRFTQVRTTEQIDLQALHRIRDQLVSSSYAAYQPGARFLSGIRRCHSPRRRRLPPRSAPCARQRSQRSLTTNAAHAGRAVRGRRTP